MSTIIAVDRKSEDGPAALGKRPDEDALSDAEKRDIEHEFTLYEQKPSVALEALRIVQKHRGWISDQSLRAVSDYLQVPVAHLESIATYFQLLFRQPVGKEVIFLCKSASCWITGCDQLQAHLKSKLGIEPGQTTPDGVFTLLESPCLGDCDKAPVLMLGEQMHQNLTSNDLDQLIERKIREHAEQSSD